MVCIEVKGHFKGRLREYGVGRMGFSSVREVETYKRQVRRLVKFKANRQSVC